MRNTLLATDHSFPKCDALSALNTTCTNHVNMYTFMCIYVSMYMYTNLNMNVNMYEVHEHGHKYEHER
jgi:hypothetical protein